MQVSDDANVMLNGFGTVVNSLKMRAKPYLPQICGTIKWRLNNKSAKIRQQAADLIARIAIVMKVCALSLSMASQLLMIQAALRSSWLTFILPASHCIVETSLWRCSFLHSLAKDGSGHREGDAMLQCALPDSTLLTCSSSPVSFLQHLAHTCTPPHHTVFKTAQHNLQMSSDSSIVGSADCSALSWCTDLQ